MDKTRLKNIIAEEVARVLQQESGLNELSKLNENKFRDVSDKFKNALDRLPDKAFTTKNIEKLIKKMKEKRPDAAMAYTKDAFGWLMKESINEAPKVAPQTRMEFGVEYRDSKGRPKKDNPLVMRFKTKAQADKYAKRGNKVDRVGGKYTVVQVPIEEKFDSKAQQRYMFATNPKAAKKLASKMTKKDYEELPDKVSKENVAPDHDGKAAPFGSGYKKVKDLEESTKAYEKALQKMARDNKLKMLSKSDKEKLIKIAQMLKKANESVNEAKLNEATYKKGQKVKYQLDKGSIKALKPSEGTISKVKKVGKYIQYTIMDGGPVPVWEPEILGLSGADKKAGKGVFESVNEATSLWKHFDAKMKLQDEIMDLEYDMKMINRDLSQLHKDMEQEAEPEGGPKATRYGRDIEKKEKEYKKKKAEFKRLMKKLDKMEQY